MYSKPGIIFKAANQDWNGFQTHLINGPSKSYPQMTPHALKILIQSQVRVTRVEHFDWSATKKTLNLGGNNIFLIPVLNVYHSLGFKLLKFQYKSIPNIMQINQLTICVTDKILISTSLDKNFITA